MTRACERQVSPGSKAFARGGARAEWRGAPGCDVAAHRRGAPAGRAGGAKEETTKVVMLCSGVGAGRRRGGKG